MSCGLVVIPAAVWMSHWSRRRDSNPQPAVYKTAALPIELRRRDGQGHTAEDPVAPGNDRAGRRSGQAWGRAGRSRRWLGPAVVGAVGGGSRPARQVVARPTGSACASAGRRASVGRRPRRAAAALGLGSARRRGGRRRGVVRRAFGVVGLGFGGVVGWRGGLSAAWPRPGCGRRRRSRRRSFGGAASSAPSAACASAARAGVTRGSAASSGGAAGMPCGSRWARPRTEDRPGHGRVQRSDDAPHRDPHDEIAAAADGRPQALALAADDDRQRAAESALPGGQRRIRLGAGDPQAAAVEIAQGARQVVDRAQQQVLDGACRRLDRRGRERRLATVGNTTPCTPAASALRRSVPTF